MNKDTIISLVLGFVVLSVVILMIAIVFSQLSPSEMVGDGCLNCNPDRVSQFNNKVTLSIIAIAIIFSVLLTIILYLFRCSATKEENE